MKAELGPLVKWIGDDGGWRTGRLVSDVYGLVQHSCTFELEWVDPMKLEPWQTREEWGDVK